MPHNDPRIHHHSSRSRSPSVPVLRALDRDTMSGNRSKKTLATHSPADAAAADRAATKAGEVKFQRGRPGRPFDWDSVTPEQREAAMADYKKRKSKT